MKKNRETKNMQAVFYTVISLMLTAVFVLAAVPKKTDAAEKPWLSKTEMTIGVGSYTVTSDWKWNDGFYRNVLNVNNVKKNASYSFASSKKNVATVKKKGTSCYITGVKAGKTTITCYQTLKKKKTVVGKCKVEVKNVELGFAGEELAVTIGENRIFGAGDGSHFFWLKYMNPQASYKFVSDKPGVMIQCKKENKDGEKGFYLTYTASEAGTYTIALKETYKKKTKTVQKFKIAVYEPKVRENYDVQVGQAFYVPNLFEHSPELYWYESVDDGLFVLVSESMIRAVKEGVGTIKFYHWDGKSETPGDYIGECTVTVTLPKAKETYEIEIDSWDGEYDSKYISANDLMENTAFGATYEVTGKDFEIKDAENGQPVYVDEDGSLKAVRPGTAEVEIYYWDKDNDKLGEYIGSCIITVTANED